LPVAFLHASTLQARGDPAAGLKGGRMKEGYRKGSLPNGTRVVTERMEHVRSVAVGVWVETGSRHEPENRGGMSHLIEHLVFKGTATRSAEAVARMMETFAGQMDGFTRRGQSC